VNDLLKLLLFAAAVYGAYKAVRTAWQLGTELLG
jgi:hypothetical protein